MYKYKNFYALILYAFMALMIQGCSTLGYGDIKIDTTRKSILVANAEIMGATMLVRDLINRRAISSGQAQDVKDNLQNAKNLLQTALIAVDRDGDPIAAESSLRRAKIGIRIALSVLGPIAEANR